MTPKQCYSATEIAKSLGVSKQSVYRRANKESWPYEEENVRGGKRRLFSRATLPADIRSALQKQVLGKALPAINSEILTAIMKAIDSARPDVGTRELADIAARAYATFIKLVMGEDS